VPGAIAPGIYMAEDVVSSDGTIAPETKVIFHAGDYVSLTPNFWAQQGSDFWALILACNVGPKPADKPISESGDIAFARANSENSNREQLQLRCSPNPTTYRLFAEFDLPTDGTYSLYVRNLQGRLIQTFASEEFRQAGQYHLELDASLYQAGVYVLTLQTSKIAVSERFVVAR
jgi:hypothetical protein